MWQLVLIVCAATMPRAQCPDLSSFVIRPPATFATAEQCATAHGNREIIETGFGRYVIPRCVLHRQEALR